VHQPGKTHLQADALSRLSTHQKTDEEDNQEQIVLKPQHFARLAASHFVNPLEERIRKATEQELEVVKGLMELKQGGLKRLADGIAEWEEDQGLVYRRGRVYVLPDDELRKEVVKQCHDGGIHSTLDLVSTHYWWPLYDLL
jgi:hypothetical protein